MTGSKPRSGERIRPTGASRGLYVETKQAPKGRKKRSYMDSYRTKLEDPRCDVPIAPISTTIHRPDM
jgi:hypothetical protein